MNILPAPKSVKRGKGILKFSGVRFIGTEREKEIFSRVIKERTGDNPLTVNFFASGDIKKDGYRLEIKDSVKVFYGSESGLFYAAHTLRQLIKDETLPFVTIADEPDFEERGIMLDISRNKVPKIETLFGIVDFISSLKMNGLQLYIEGRSFYYTSFNDCYENGYDVLTAEDVKRLDAYCRERFVKLAPNQNTFGHMADWLSLPDFADMAECPDGFNYSANMHAPPATLDPLDPRSADFAVKLLKEISAAHNSDTINIGGDEPFELGLGKSAAAVEKYGKGKIYVDYMLKIIAAVQGMGLRPMMWGDIVKCHPETVKSLPPETIMLEWGYEPGWITEENCALYENAGLCFYVCPGTSLWLSGTGRSSVMLKNIKEAARCGYKHNAKGLLLTDWGDGGTAQQYPFLFLPYACGAAYAWNANGAPINRIFDYLDENVFEGEIASLLYRLGDYVRLEARTNESNTRLFKLLYNRQTDDVNLDVNPSDCAYQNSDDCLMSKCRYEKLYEYLTKVKSEIEGCDFRADFREEVLFAADLVLHAAKLGLFLTDINSKNRKNMRALKEDLISLIERHKTLWLLRNKESNRKLAVQRFETLLRKYNAILNEV